MISIVCWKWHNEDYRSTYTAEHVITLFNMVARNVTVPFRFFCVTDDPDGLEHTEIITVKLWDNPCPAYGGGKKPNCYYRIKMFATEMKEIFGERFIWLDLDCVITGNLDHIVGNSHEFAIWRPDGEQMPCNGSLVSNKIGTRNQIWTRFDKRRVDPVRGLQRAGVSGSDQAWIALNLKSTDAFLGKAQGIYSWRSHIKPVNPETLEYNTRIVFFNGAEKPWSPEVAELPWVREYYR